MKLKLEFKQSFKRFTKIQKIIALFFIFTTLFSILILFLMKDIKLFLVVFGIATTVVFIIFNSTKNNRPFVLTKSSMEKFNLLGEANFYLVKKTFTTTSPFNSKFRYKNLLMIREYRQDGSLFTETPYKNGKIWGEVKTFSIHGKLRKSATYYEGDIEGKKIELDGSSVAKENNYKGAMLHGVSKTFDKDTGNLISEENFKYGVHHGKSSYFNAASGLKTHVEFYKNGKKYGISKFYNDEEILIKEIEYQNGLIHGKVIEYFTNGNEMSLTEYKLDKKDGVYKEFYEDGTIKIECRFRDDQKHGPHIAYYKSGVIMTKNFYDLGEKKGDSIFYDPDGNPVT